MQFYVTKYYFLHKKTAIIKIAVLHSWLIKQIYKRSSVFDNHLSRLIVTNKLERPTYRRMRATSLMPYLGLAPGGVYTARLVTQSTVSSYLAFSSLPHKVAVIFCCTFLRITPTRCYLAPCSMELRLSSRSLRCPRLSGLLNRILY